MHLCNMLSIIRVKNLRCLNIWIGRIMRHSGRVHLFYRPKICTIRCVEQLSNASNLIICCHLSIKAKSSKHQPGSHVVRGYRTHVKESKLRAPINWSASHRATCPAGIRLKVWFGKKLCKKLRLATTSSQNNIVFSFGFIGIPNPGV